LAKNETNKEKHRIIIHYTKSPFAGVIGKKDGKPLFSRAEKYPDFQVTSCLQNDTTNVDFAYIKS
jgi:hypothetical protein